MLQMHHESCKRNRDHSTSDSDVSEERDPKKKSKKRTEVKKEKAQA